MAGCKQHPQGAQGAWLPTRHSLQSAPAAHILPDTFKAEQKCLTTASSWGSDGFNLGSVGRWEVVLSSCTPNAYRGPSLLCPTSVPAVRQCCPTIIPSSDPRHSSTSRFGDHPTCTEELTEIREGEQLPRRLCRLSEGELTVCQVPVLTATRRSHVHEDFPSSWVEAFPSDRAWAVCVTSAAAVDCGPWA